MKKFIQRGMTICVLFTLVLMLLPHEMFAIQPSADTSSIASFEMKWTSAAVDGCIEYDANDVSKVTLTPAENKAKAAGTSITAQVKTDSYEPASNTAGASSAMPFINSRAEKNHTDHHQNQ